jgi:1,2-diacylglycerol 3-beta-galactosyltransferase
VNRRDIEMRDTPRVELIYFDAGGGHRAAASALGVALARHRPGWQVTLVNLRDVLEPLDFIQRLTGVRVEGFYNGLLKSNLTAGLGAMLRILHLLVRRMHTKMVPVLAAHWTARRPDLVVSLIPHFNRAMFEGLRSADTRLGRPATPMATIMTDLADYPPHFWIERQEQFMICGSAAATQQALAAGLPPELILRTSGMIVRPEFYAPATASRVTARRTLGLDPGQPTGLVMFGGFGSRRMELIAKRVADAGLKTQLIFLCGRNQELRERLAALDLPYPHHIEGFTSAIPDFMRLADFFVGKPGPGSISEALVMGLPVIVERNALTMVHERFNTDWVLRQGVGVVVKSFNAIDQAIARVLDPKQLAAFCCRIRATENRAIFELPVMLEGVMAAAGGVRPSAVKLGA